MRGGGQEGGGALIAVLALLGTAGMLVIAMAVLSQISRTEIATAAELGYSRYVAEGAANRIRWLILADRALFADAVPGNIDYDDYDHDRYLADGVEHRLDYYGTPVEFVITDAITGLAITSGNTANELNKLTGDRTTDTALSDAITLFAARIGDYIDSDDAVSVDGMEESDYEGEGREPLPRNGALEYREELLWIPGGEKFMALDAYGRLAGVRPVPAGSYGYQDSRPNLFTAGYTLLRTYGGLEPEEAAEVLAALEVWQREHTKLEDQLGVDLLADLNNNFRVNESGVYHLLIRRAAPENRPTARLSASFAVDDAGTCWEYLRF